MGPPKGAQRRPVSFKSMHTLEFSKQLQVFALHGGACHNFFALEDGDRVLPGDSVEIDPDVDLSGTAVDGEPWIAKVLEIKSDNQSKSLKDLFIKIHWYYTESNLNNYGPSIGPTVGNLRTCNFAANELVLSNHEQIICADSILKRVDVYFFNEVDPSPCDVFGDDDFWYRYSFKVGGNGAMNNRLVTADYETLPAARCAVDGCHARYTPDAEHQRYCPRSTCQYWFHEQCLEVTGFKPIDQGTPLNLLPMLAGTPGFDDRTLDLDFLKMLERYMYRVLDDNDNTPLPKKLLDEEPKWKRIKGLIWCAATPIIRGQKHGVIGTGCLVEEARDIIAQMMRSSNKDEPYWPSREHLRLFKKWAQPEWTVTFRCNRCNGFI